MNHFSQTKKARTPMNVLILGSGGREYSIGRALKQESKVNKIFFAPGNGATENLGENLSIREFDELAQFAISNGIDLTIVGPEAPLTDGVVDIFKAQGLNIFGPGKEAAQLEGSKVYMKNFLKKHNIPTAKFIETDDLAAAAAFIETMRTPIVVKADGLCAGKGVIIAQSHDEAKETVREMLSGEAFGDAGKKVIVEEFLDGFELSVFAICDGENFIILPAAQDHKRLLDNDQGPNTGGMGAYCPTPLATDALMEKIKNDLIRPTVDGMKADGVPFEGVLFAGVMVVDDTPYILEYNVRFGDPECEEIMALIDSSVFDLFDKAARKELDTLDIRFKNKVAIGVVAASRDYPYASTPPARITVSRVDDESAHIAYAGVSKRADGLYADGGRVLVSVGVGSDIKEARANAYALLEHVAFDGMQYRSDIAYQALEQ
jgi:phosphoribosylamine--glycine ligase